MRESVERLVESITAQVKDALVNGVDWTPGWVTFGGHRRLSDPDLAPYQGTNQFFLTLLAMIHQLAATNDDGDMVGHVWGGAKQWIGKGFMMKKGTKSLYRPIRAYRVKYCQNKAHNNKCAESCKERVSFMNVKTLAPIFHQSQVFKLEDDAVWPEVVTLPGADVAPSDLVARWQSAGMVIDEVGDQPSFVPDLDVIRMPKVEQFLSQSAYDNTINHEATHWTGHSSRLDRPVRNQFGTPAYAKEELVAEIGAAMLAVELGLTPEPHPDHANYLASWIQALGSDPKFLYDAAVDADKATKFLMGLGTEAKQEAA